MSASLPRQNYFSVNKLNVKKKIPIEVKEVSMALVYFREVKIAKENEKKIDNFNFYKSLHSLSNQAILSVTCLFQEALTSSWEQLPGLACWLCQPPTATFALFPSPKCMSASTSEELGCWEDELR